jgi:hypothetical protein
VPKQPRKRTLHPEPIPAAPVQSVAQLMPQDPVPRKAPTSFWERYAALIDGASKIISTAAILVGAWWAYRQFYVHREDAHNLIVELKPRIVATDTGSPVLIADVYLTNIGKVAIWPAQPKTVTSGEGCELSVIEYSDPSKGQSDDLPIIDYDRGGGRVVRRLTKHNLLSHYAAYAHGNYVLNPGSKYHETSAIPVSRGKLYCLRVRFFTQEGWTSADFAYVYVPASVSK